MRFTDEEILTLLEGHRANLAAATDFAAYKVANIAYVDMLIEQSRASLDQTRTIARFIAEASGVSDDRSQADAQTVER